MTIVWSYVNKLDLTFGINLAKVWNIMARPKKDPKLLKDEMLRIPVSAAEKQLINNVATAVDGEMARWARRVLLREAEGYAAANGGASPHKPKKGNGRKRVA